MSIQYVKGPRGLEGPPGPRGPMGSTGHQGHAGMIVLDGTTFKGYNGSAWVNLN